jgi:symplekin
LVRLRATIANKIINTVLNFNPFKLANSPMTPTSKVQIRSMERTTRALLHNFLKKYDKYPLTEVSALIDPRSPHHPLAIRVHQYIERLQHTRIEVFDEFNRKRPAPAEAIDGLDPAKRQRISPDLPGVPQQQIVGFPPAGPVSFAQLFKLTDGPESSDFDVKSIPHELVIRILIPMLQSIDRAQLDAAINIVRARYLTLTAAQNQVNNRIPLDVPAPEDDDDYEPEYVPTEDAEQIRNRMEMEAEDDGAVQAPVAALGTFKLGPAPLLARQVVERINATALGHLQERMEIGGVAAKGPGSSHQRSVPYISLIQRLASRLCIGLELDDNDEDEEAEGKERVGGGNSKKRGGGGTGGVNGMAVAKTTTATSFGNRIRQRILQYVLQDWRRRIDVAISWLTEEWVADRAVECMNARKMRENGDARSVNGEQQRQASTTGMGVGDNYRKWLHKLLDELAAFIGSEPSEIKVLVRLLSEIPAIDVSIVEKVKRLALDPERVPLVIPSLRFLIMFRPPVREIALDAVEDMWRNCEFNFSLLYESGDVELLTVMTDDGAKSLAGKDLGKWRPEVLKESQESDGMAEVKVEG